MTVVGTYELIGPVGAGSTSTVWKARDLQLDRYVALKRLDDQAAGSRDQWRAEARTLASLSEPHIVEVYGFTEDDESAYIVEEWVDGATLAAVLSGAGRLSAAQALGVLRGALLGLAHAHGRGVVHRDVSANNILVDSAGTSRLIDFGLAAGTGTGGSYGTSAYRSPEAAGRQPATPASDVYSAAAVLTHLLTGTAATPPATDLVDSELRPVLRRALADNPAERYADAGAFLAALEEAANRRYGAAWWTEAGMAALASGAGVAVVASAASGKRSEPEGAVAAAVVIPGQQSAAAAGGVSRRTKVIAAGAASAVILGGIGAAVAAGGKTNAPKPQPAAVSSTAAAAASVAPTPTPEPPSSPAAPSSSAAPTPTSSTPSPSPTSKAPAITPAQGLAGKYALSGVVTKIVNVDLINEATLAPLKPGDPLTLSQWTVTAACPPGKPCTATVVSSSGRRYAMTLTAGHWRGTSVPFTTVCYDGARIAPGIHATVTIDVDIPDPSATLAKAPAKLTGTQLRRYDNGCQGGGGTLSATLVITRS